MSLAPMTIARITATPPSGTSTTGTNSTGSGTSGSTTTAGSSELGREAFLQLLVAQLKYQDPSKPMDASAMIQQSSQLTMVDKLSDISSALAGQAMTNQLTLAGSVLGKQITFTGTDGVKITAPVNSVKFVNGALVLSTPDWDVPMSSVESIGLVSPAPVVPVTTPASIAPASTTPAASAPPASIAPASTTPAAAPSSVANASSSGTTPPTVAPDAPVEELTAADAPPP